MTPKPEIVCNICNGSFYDVVTKDGMPNIHTCPLCKKGLDGTYFFGSFTDGKMIEKSAIIRIDGKATKIEYSQIRISPPQPEFGKYSPTLWFFHDNNKPAFLIIEQSRVNDFTPKKPAKMM